jgi:hypothetical protein
MGTGIKDRFYPQSRGSAESGVSAELIEVIERLAVDFGMHIECNQPEHIRVRSIVLHPQGNNLHAGEGCHKHPFAVEIDLRGG